MAWKKPLPVADEDMAPFWAGLGRHEFLLFRCQECGAWYWPVAFCRNHDNQPFYGNLEWTKSSGKGKVFTFNIHYRAFHPGFRDDLPYVYALIELEEGPMFGSNIIGCDPQEVKIGMPVEVVYEDIMPEGGESFEPFTLPKFRPVKE